MKLSIFFCSINGTFRGYSNYSKNFEEDTKEFLNNLELLRKYHKTDKIVFSFLSGSSKEVVISEMNYLKIMNNNPNIIMGNQFFLEGYISDNICKVLKEIPSKIEQMLSYLDYLGKDNLIEGVYYADECEFHHIIIPEFQKDYNTKYPITSIIPNQLRGVNEVNEIIGTDILKIPKVKAKKYPNIKRYIY